MHSYATRRKQKSKKGILRYFRDEDINLSCILQDKRVSAFSFLSFVVIWKVDNESSHTWCLNMKALREIRNVDTVKNIDMGCDHVTFLSQVGFDHRSGYLGVFPSDWQKQRPLFYEFSKLETVSFASTAWLHFHHRSVGPPLSIALSLLQLQRRWKWTFEILN